MLLQGHATLLLAALLALQQEEVLGLRPGEAVLQALVQARTTHMAGAAAGEEVVAAVLLAATAAPVGQRLPGTPSPPLSLQLLHWVHQALGQAGMEGLAAAGAAQVRASPW